MYQLGGHALFLSSKESQIGRGEPVEDTARVLSRYCDGIMIRTYSQEEVEKLAEYADIPVINGLTDFAHPCQVLADLMTIREHQSKLEGLKMCFIGDGNNMVNSLIVGGLKVGMDVSVACPEGYDPHPACAGFRQDRHRCQPDHCPGPHRGRPRGRRGLYRCVGLYGSGGGGRQAPGRLPGLSGQRRAHESTNPGCMVQHCLPAHRGEEITGEVFEAHAGEIFDEAENRLHAQKAVLYLLMGENQGK